MQKDPFGLLVTIMTFRSFEEVIERSNSVEYGLTSYVFNRSQRLAHDTANALEAVWLASILSPWHQQKHLTVVSSKAGTDEREVFKEFTII